MKKWAFLTFAVVAVLGILVVGAYNQSTNVAQQTAHAGDTMETAMIKAEEAKTRQIETAMLSGKAVSGMSKYQVLKSMGPPESVEKTSSIADDKRREALQSVHAFETLHYYSRDTMVLVDTGGEVVFVTTYAK